MRKFSIINFLFFICCFLISDKCLVSNCDNSLPNKLVPQIDLKHNSSSHNENADNIEFEKNKICRNEFIYKSSIFYLINQNNSEYFFHTKKYKRYIFIKTGLSPPFVI